MIIFHDKFCDILHLYTNCNVCPITIKVWEVVEHTSVNVSGIILRIGVLYYYIQSELGYSKTEIHQLFI